MKSLNIITKITLLPIIFIFIILFSCKKDKEDLVPYVYVDFPIYLNEPGFSDLNAVGNSVTVTGGVSGIVIYRASQDEFVAIERCCSYFPSDRCPVEVELSGVSLICKCCNSKFSIYDGTVMRQPASRGLTLYKVEYNQANNSLHVTN